MVAALRLGDRTARDALVDRHGPFIERVLARILGYDAELPDVLHDVFITALGRIENLRQPALLKPWLRGRPTCSRRTSAARGERTTSQHDAPPSPTHRQRSFKGASDLCP